LSRDSSASIRASTSAAPAPSSLPEHLSPGPIIHTSAEPAIVGPQRDEIYVRLGQIEALVKRLDSEHASDRERIHIDSQDLNDPAFRADSKLKSPTPVNTGELASHEFVTLRFGSVLLAALARSGVLGERDVLVEAPTLVLAKALPANPHQNVAFRNSFFFDSNARVLYVRRERLNNMGGFVLVLVHVFAHIVSHSDGSNWDDRNPNFVSTFLSCLRAICSDLVMARAYQPLQIAADGKALSSLLPAVREEAINGLMEMFPLAPSEQITDVSLLPLENSFFTREKMIHRLEQYNYFHQGADLGKLLVSMEKAADRRDYASEESLRESLLQRREQTRQRKERPGVPQWKDIARSAVDVNEGVLGEMTDSLNSDLVCVVSALREAIAASAALQQRKEAQDISPSELAELDRLLHNENLAVSDLSLRKDVLLQRLADLDSLQPKP